MYFTVEYGPTQRPNMVLLFMIIASTKTQLPRGELNTWKRHGAGDHLCVIGQFIHPESFFLIILDRRGLLPLCRLHLVRDEAVVEEAVVGRGLAGLCRRPPSGREKSAGRRRLARRQRLPDWSWIVLALQQKKKK